MSIRRHLLLAASLLLGPLAGSATAQELPSPGPNLFVIPALGVAREATRPSFDLPALDAWLVGAQVEYAIPGGWTPLVAAHRWRFDLACEDTPVCGRTGWSAEAGATRELAPAGYARPYAGLVVGVHRVEEAFGFMQGRAGIDLILPRSPVALRVEGRFHRPLAQRTKLGQFFVLNTGIRLALPRP